MPESHQREKDREVTRAFPKDLASLEELLEAVALFCSGHGLDGSVVFAMQFSAEEVFTNMIKYNPGTVDDVRMILRLEAGILTLTLIDKQEKAFDPNLHRTVDVDKPLEDRVPGGLGIFLTRQMVDRVEYNHANNESTITLTKKLEGSDV